MMSWKMIHVKFQTFGIRMIYSIIFALAFVGVSKEAWSQKEWKQYFYENGKVSSEGYLLDGKPEGYWKTYYPDGGLKSEGNRLSFKLDSVWTFYRDDSTMEKRITYKEDLRNGIEQIFDAQGKLKEEYTYLNNIKEGPARLFYPTGEVQKVSEFKNNKEEGKAKEFERDGRIITLMTYRNGFIYSSEKINRYNHLNQRTGIWMDLHTNGVVREEGPWSNDLRNGIFKFYDRKGELLRMEKYVDGQIVLDNEEAAILDIRREFNENGELVAVGSYRGGKKHGTFRMYDPRGNEEGSIIYDDGQKIAEGKLDSLGRRQGSWVFYYPTGERRAEGAYINGLKDGPWTYFFKDGKIEQKGNYKEDYSTGSWKWFYPSGSVHREEGYRRGKEDGHAVEWDTLGNVITEGDFIDGLKSGKWILKVNDHFEEGEYADGERNGIWIWKYDNGQKAFEGEFQLGTPIGKHRYWYYSGQLKMKGGYEGGELQGVWQYFNEDGTSIQELEYEVGIVVKINGQRIKLPPSKEAEE